MGHSRGGEGVAAAVQLNQRTGSPFGIKAALALAPVDFDRRVIGGVELGVILPYCDGDVSDLQGAAYYDDGRYASPGDPRSKMTALLYGANHNFFNTVWTTGPGSFDDAGFFGEARTGSRAGPVPARRARAGSPPPSRNRPAPRSWPASCAGTCRATWTCSRSSPGPRRTRHRPAPTRWTIAFHAAHRLDVEPLGHRRDRPPATRWTGSPPSRA